MVLIENTINKWFWSFIVILGLIFIFLVPPFQKPDEIEHFYRSVGVINKLTCDKGNFLCVNQRFYDLPAELQAENIKFKYNEKFDWKLLNIEDKNNKLVKHPYDVFGLDFLGYIMSAWGILIGSIFSNPVISFYFGRLFNFLFFIGCLFVSLKVIPKQLTLVLLFFASLPMVVHQASAISYDAMNLSLIMLIFSFWMKFWFDEKIKTRNYLIFLLLLVLFVTIKYGYWFFFLLLWLIPYKKIRGNYLWPIILSILGLTGLFLFRYSYFTVSMGWRLNLRPGDFYGFQQKILFEHPSIFLKLVLNTINTMGQSYVEMMIGVLGWLDYKLTFFVYLLYLFIYLQMIRYIANKDLKLDFGWIRFLGLIIVLLLIVISVFTGMYFYETQPGDKLIPSQGRYFLSLIPFLTLILIIFYRWFKTCKFKFWIYVLVGLLLSISIFRSVKTRYFDYSYFISEPNYLDAKWKNYASNQAVPKNENYLVNEKFTYNLNIGTSKNKIRGFEFAFVSEKNGVNIPYLYFIKDKQCQKTLDSGFLDQKQLSLGGVYKQNFNLKKYSENEICLWIEPYYKGKGANYLNIIKFNGEYLVRPLQPRSYIVSELNQTYSLKRNKKITTNSPIYQTFKAIRNNLNGIGVLTTNYDLYNPLNEYKLTLYDNRCSLKLREVVIKSYFWENGEFTDIFFEPINDSKNKSYCFSLSSLDDNMTGGIYFSDKKTYKSGITIIDGKETGTDSIFRLMYN